MIMLVWIYYYYYFTRTGVKNTSCRLLIAYTHERLSRKDKKFTLIRTDLTKWFWSACLHNKKNYKRFSITFDENALFCKIASLPHKLKSFSANCAGKCFLDILSCCCFVFRTVSTDGKFYYFEIRSIYYSVSASLYKFSTKRHSVQLGDSTVKKSFTSYFVNNRICICRVK